jgi:phosphatidylglycerol lysyltransferase
VKKLLRNISPIISAILFGVALYVIHYKLRQYHYRDIVKEVRLIPLLPLIASIMLAFFNYFVLTGYDTLAMRYIGQKLKYPQIAFASFIGYAFGHNATVLGGSAARYRIYSSLGIGAFDVGRLVIFNTLTFWLGFFMTGGIFFLLQPQEIPESFHFPFTSVQPLGIVFLVLILIYLIIAFFVKDSLKIKQWEFKMPSMPICFEQIALSCVDWLAAASVLYVLLPPLAGLTYAKFVGIFLLAQIIGLMSSVPGGLGVFETVILLLLSDYEATAAITASIIVYRMVYYLLPLTIASVLLGGHELITNRQQVKKIGLVFNRLSSALIPQIFSLTVFMAGVILIISGALPAAKGRLEILVDFLPLPAIELSHFLGSIVGVGLLILARGLQKRINAAYHFTIILLAAGILFSLFKGLDYEEAIILTVMLGALIPCKKEFYRKASLLTEPFTPTWIVSIIAIVVCSFWLGLFSYKYINYSNELWWRFTLSGDAPRFLRATTAVMILLLFYFFWGILKPKGKRAIALREDSSPEKIESIVLNCHKTYSWLALLGDKKFLFNEAGNTFIMYGVQGRSWIVLGDPVGPKDQWQDLMWDFKELCDEYDGWPVFYQVDKTHLDMYVELGLNFLKLGEEADVDIQKFSLEGNAHSSLRNTHNKMTRENFSFSIIAPQDVPPLMAKLEEVSNRWLEGKKTREKGFSIGFFNPQYLARMPMAIVKKDDKITAFANILLGAQKEEMSVDLMRFVPESPDGIMDYLFTELLLWGKKEGFRFFNFGMAPLSGLENRPLAPLWTQSGAYIFRYGEHFYNFQGLRQYKEKFDPEWQPKFLACPKGFILPRVLTNIAALISGGMTGIIKK